MPAEAANPESSGVQQGGAYSHPPETLAIAEALPRTLLQGKTGLLFNSWSVNIAGASSRKGWREPAAPARATACAAVHLRSGSLASQPGAQISSGAPRGFSVCNFNLLIWLPPRVRGRGAHGGGLILRRLSLACCSPCSRPTFRTKDENQDREAATGRGIIPGKGLSANEETRHPKFPEDKASQGQQQRPLLHEGGRREHQTIIKKL